MARARTTADLIVNALRRANELTDGSSAFATQAADYIDQIHNSVVTGGTEFEVDIDEPWLWARSRRPVVIELQPFYETGSVTLTQDSISGTFSAGPASSLEGWYIFLKNSTNPELYRIAQHTAASTAFSLDGVFTGSTASGLTYRAVKLDYDLVSDYITVDAENDKLDFISRGTTLQTATLAHGVYTPSGLATQAATQLQAADTNSNTYTGSYDTNRRYFSFVSALNGTATAIFSPQGANTNFYRSGWETLGFDFANPSTNATQTSIYPFSSVVRLVSKGRVYYGGTSGQVEGIDPNSFDRDWPLSGLQGGVPTHFCAIRDKADGLKTIRINRYPDKRMRLEFEAILQPKDLLNSAYSIPLLPKKYVRLLEYGTAYFLMQDKNDEKAPQFFQLSQQLLRGMMKENRKELQRTGNSYGAIIARADLIGVQPGRNNQYGYDWPWWRY